MIGIRIRDLHADDEGHYRATVINGDLEVPVNRQFGSWQTDAGREVMPAVAAMLQQLVKRDERAAGRLERKHKEVVG